MKEKMKTYGYEMTPESELKIKTPEQIKKEKEDREKERLAIAAEKEALLKNPYVEHKETIKKVTVDLTRPPPLQKVEKPKNFVAESKSPTASANKMKMMFKPP